MAEYGANDFSNMTLRIEISNADFKREEILGLGKK